MKNEESFWAKVDRSGGPDACWTWTATRLPYGYGTVWFCGTTWRTHRLAWVLTNGEIADGLWVLHRCDNPPCVNPAHLFLGTNADNIADRVRKRRSRCGERHPFRRQLTDDSVREIRKLFASGVSSTEVARRCGVPKGTAIRVIRGHGWAHVTDPPPIPAGRRNERQRGAGNAMAVLNEGSVRRIRAALAEGRSHGEIAAEIGVHKTTVWKVASGKRWSHVQ